MKSDIRLVRRKQATRHDHKAEVATAVATKAALRKKREEDRARARGLAHGRVEHNGYLRGREFRTFDAGA